MPATEHVVLLFLFGPVQGRPEGDAVLQIGSVLVNGFVVPEAVGHEGALLGSEGVARLEEARPLSKSGQLVEIENRVVIWTPGEKWVRYIDGKLNIIELKIKTVES